MAPRIDYEALYHEFTFKAKREGMTQGEFAESKGHHPVTISRAFADIRRNLRLEAFRRKNPKLLLLAQDRLEQALKDPEIDPKLSLEAYKAISDREGLSPTAVNVAIQNNVGVSVKIQPVLAAGEAETLRAVLRGVEYVPEEAKEDKPEEPESDD